MDLKDQLRELCAANGVNGCTQAADVATQLLSYYVNNVYRDVMGNVWGVMPCGRENAPTVLLEAHLDEIGFVVTEIDEKGFLRVSNCGGVDNRALSSASVVVVSDPPINGVFATVPPHLSSEEDKLPKLTERVVDVSGQDIQCVSIGTRVAFQPHFEEMLNNCVCSKALDNRAGVAAILQALSLIQNRDRNMNVAVAFCTQEELGLRGAKTAAFAIRPDAAVVVDVSFAHTPDADRKQCGVLGKGVMIGVSPVLDKATTDTLVRLAEEQTIPFQWEVMGGTTGTNADVTSITADGIPTALLSVPLRYMHTPTEVVSLSDIEATAQLLTTFVCEGSVQTHA